MSINIKKSHRGRFTAYKKRTGKTTAEALHSKNPHVRAMANFARNARKWKHALGGLLEDPTSRRQAVTTVYKNRWIPDTERGFYEQAIRPYNDTLSLEQFYTLPATIKSMSKYLPQDNTWKIEQGKRGSTVNRGYLKYYQNNPVNTGTDITQNGIPVFRDPGKAYLQANFPEHPIFQNGGGFFAPTDNLRVPTFAPKISNSLAPGPDVPAAGGFNFGTAGAGMASELGSGLIDAFANPDNIWSRGGYQSRANINEGAAAGKGALSGAAAGAMFGPIGMGVGALVGGIGSFFGAKNKEKRLNDQFASQFKEQQFNRDVGSRMNALQESHTYNPVARQGGFIAYKGPSHDSTSGGILVDKLGNPVDISNGEAIASVEGKGPGKSAGEVTRYNPDEQSAYVYSDKLGFANTANKLIKKYKLDKDNSQYKYDTLLKVAVDKQFDNLKNAQEFSKESKMSSKGSLGMFGSGGEFNTYEVGKEYDLSNEQIKYLNRLGYKMEML